VMRLANQFQGERSRLDEGGGIQCQLNLAATLFVSLVPILIDSKVFVLSVDLSFGMAATPMATWQLL